MPTEVILPKVDMDMATGRISRWYVTEGATVRKGDLLFEIETDKAAMEIDAPASGRLANVTGKEGVDIAVGAPVAWIYAEGEALPAGRKEPGPLPLALKADEPVASPMPEVSVNADIDAPAGFRATPLARRLASQNGIDLVALQGSGPNGRVQARDVEQAIAHAEHDAEQAAPRSVVPANAEASGPGIAASPAPAAPGPSLSPAATWLRSGPGEVPLVLIHGFGSETASWRPLLTAFGRSMPILSIELPGHGSAVDVPAANFGDLVAHVEKELALLGIGAAHLVGHSLGAAVAVAVAAGVAIEVRSLLLIAPAGLGPEINTGFTEGFAGAGDEAVLRRWMLELVADQAVLSDGFMRATHRARADGRLSAAQRRLGSQLFSQGTQHFSIRALLDHLAMPVKVIAGNADRIIPSRHMQGLPGHVGVYLFAGLGHMPQLEARAAVARVLEEHLN